MARRSPHLLALLRPRCAGIFKRDVKFELSELHIDAGNRTFVFSCKDKDMDALRRALIAPQARL